MHTSALKLRENVRQRRWKSKASEDVTDGYEKKRSLVLLVSRKPGRAKSPSHPPPHLCRFLRIDPFNYVSPGPIANE